MSGSMSIVICRYFHSSSYDVIWMENHVMQLAEGFEQGLGIAPSMACAHSGGLF